MFLNPLKRKDETYSNVTGPDELDKEIVRTLRFESAVFKRTLGPYGANTIIEDQMLHHTTTKDGWTVYRSLVFYPRLARVAARLFQKISGSLNDVVGDGTTSSVVIANELYRIRKLARKWHIPPKFLAESLKIIGQKLNEIVKKNAIPLIEYKDGGYNKTDTFEQRIQAVASISLNNDWENGKLVSDMFCSLKNPGHGFVNAELSRTNVTHYDLDRGFEITRGMLLPEMVTEPDGRRAVYVNPKILLIKGHIMTHDIEALRYVIEYVIGKCSRPLVIIAGGFCEASRESFRQSIIRFVEKHGTILKLLCIEMDTESSIGKENLQDLADNISASIITVDSAKQFPIEADPQKYDAYLGTCNKIIASTTNYTRFIGGKNNTDRIKFRIDDIDKEIDRMKSETHIDNQYNIFLLQRRKAALYGDMVTLFVGGDTIEEKENKQHLFDDAVRGCKSAIKSGIVCGGNTIIPKICHKILEEYKNRDKNNLNALVLREFVDSITTSLNKTMPSNIRKSIDKYVYEILYNICIAYTRTYAIIIDNKFRSWRKSYKIAKECIESDRTYDIINDNYEDSYTLINDKREIHRANDATKNNAIINSSEVDTQILTAAISILDLVMTSNQFLRTPKMEEMRKNL